MTEEDKIRELIDWFFDKINKIIIQNYYISDSQNWEAICASLTLINDLARPKSEYYSLKTINHLEVIGIMQTIYIEQDCIMTLHKALFGNSQKRDFSNYKSIRSLRNQAFGHPSESGRRNGNMYTRHFFDILDEQNQTIKLINWDGTSSSKSAKITILDEVKENSKITREYLEELKSEFTIKIQAHMKTYKINTSELFINPHYIFEKLHGGDHSFYDILDKDIEKADLALKERNITNDIKRELDVCSFLNDKLKSVFNSQTSSDIEFYTYADVLKLKIDYFKGLLKEIEEVF